MPKLSLVELEHQPVERLRDVIGRDRYDHFVRTMSDAADRLDGHTLWNLNSTAEGGGVAEMLGTLLPYAADTGWDVRWAVMSGEDRFFDVTKGIHNALHGVAPTDEAVWDRAADAYRATTDATVAELTAMVRPGDVVLVHDPQTAGLIGPLKDLGAVVSWQCHVGTDDPNDCTRRAWDFLRPHVERADRFVFSRPQYLWDGLDRDRLRVIPPSIDALSVKNAPMDADTIDGILTAAGFAEGPARQAAFRRSEGTQGSVTRKVSRTGDRFPVPAGARVVLEVSRWDRLKDPIGFLRMHDERLAERDDVHVVFAGPATNGVADDPEGTSVLEACEEVWRSLRPEVQGRVHLLQVPMEDVDENAAIVNALQRRADVVVQKSIEEGFGLTVAEAMWKARPVVASRVGGIQDQIEHERSGILVDDPYDIGAFAHAVASLLDAPERAQRLGAEAHKRVREHYLGPRQLEQYADLVAELIGAA